MKKFLIIFLLLLFSCPTFAQKSTNSLNFSNSKFVLLYSTKDDEHSGFLNEYFKVGETPDIWSEMIAIHHFPNVFSPIEQAYAFREYLSSLGCPNSINVNEEKNTGTVDFIIISKKQLPAIIEFNIFKYEKSPICGTIASQYVKRYSVTNELELEAVKNEFSKKRLKMLKKFNKLKIPNIETEAIPSKTTTNKELETNTVNTFDLFDKDEFWLKKNIEDFFN